jgi:type IV secretion system protein VirB6
MGFFANFWSWLNTQLATYIGVKVAAVALVLEPAAVTIATIYVMIWGYMHLRGMIQEPLVSGAVRVFTIIAILGVGIRLWLYNTVITNTFYTAPSQLAAILVGSPSTVGTLDTIWINGAAVADQFLAKGSLFSADFAFYVAGYLVYIIMGLTCLYTMFLIGLSKIALAVLLALGPLFIISLFFDTTKRFFEAWIAQLANYALITVLAVAVTSLMLSALMKFAADTASLGAGIRIADAVDMLLLAVMVFLVMRQVMPMAAGLASGIALSTYGAVSRTMAWALGASARSGGQYARGLADIQTTRWDSLSRKAGYLTKRGAQALTAVAMPRIGRGNRVSRDTVMPPARLK